MIHDPDTKEEPLLGDVSPNSRRRSTSVTSRRLLLVGCFLVLFSRYCIATFLSAFFSPLADGWGITPAFNGLIFAAYPLGMALTSLVAPPIIRVIGTRRAVAIGLMCTSATTALFGIAPKLAPPGESLQWLFFGSYFLNGLTGALAETACIILISSSFKESLGAVMAAVSTVCAVGCMVGPVIGGLLYDTLDASAGAWKFGMPFAVCSIAELLLIAPLC